MIVKKVSIDELVHILLDMRRTTEYVDMQINAENTLKVRRHVLPPKEEKPLDDFLDLNQLFA